MARQRIPTWAVPAAIAGGVAAAAISVAVFVGASAPAPGQTTGSPLHIIYFQPPEPEIKPGSVMDVGPVVDGYVHRPPPPSSPYVDVAYLHDEASYDPASVSVPTRQDDVAQVTVYTAMQPKPSGEKSGPITFDDPLPAFAEARRLRAIELDRRLVERRATPGQAASMAGAQPNPEYQPDNAFF